MRATLREYARMNASTAPIGSWPGQSREQHAARMWLDALATGACDQETFLREVNALAPVSPDALWEALSLLDQYHRLGRIRSELFHTLKSQLQNSALGREQDSEMSVPLPLAHCQLDVGHVAVPVGVTASRHEAGPTAVFTTPPAAPGREAKLSPPHARGRSGERMLAEGDVLRERYRIVRMLGQGGMGTVFEALDQYRVDLTTVSNRVAIKVLHTAVTQRLDLLAELRSEFWHLQSLSHPNILRAFEFDRDGDTEFFTMELLKGAPLSRVLGARTGRALRRPYALAIIRDIGAALAHAHSRGVVHGDINPGNILITDEGEVRVLDFGASRKLRDGPWIADFDLPRPGPVATPAYASCQLLSGETAGPRDDLFAFACVAYVLLTGRRPFRGHTAVEARALRVRPRRPGGLTRRQWRALRAALNFERERRPSGLAECVHRLDLREAARRLPTLPVLMTAAPRSRRAAIVTTASALIMLLAAGGLWVTTDHDALVRNATVLIAGATRTVTTAGPFIAGIWSQALTRAGISDDASVTSAARPAPSPSASPAATGATGQAPRLPVATAAEAVVSDTAAAGALATDSEASLAARQAAAPQPAPRTATVRARVELAADMVEVSPSEPMARVVVRRRGNLRGDVSFAWWTESGTAKPGEDYVAFAPRVEHIADAKSAFSLLIPVVSDSTRRQTRSFYVVIDEVSPGASLGPRTVTMVTMHATE